MIYEEKTIESKKIFEGKIIDLRVETIEFPDGSTAYRELVDHPGGVGVLALTTDGKIPLVKQYRKPFEAVMYEIPAGKLDSKDEDRLEAAKRELKEETGYTAKTWINIGEYLPAAAYCDELITLYIAKGLEKGEQNLDDDEFLNIEFYPLDDLIKDVIEGKISDGKTQVALLKAKYFLSQD